MKHLGLTFPLSHQVHTHKAVFFCFVFFKFVIKLMFLLNSAGAVLWGTMWMNSIRVVNVSVCVYIWCRSSWLRLQGDPRLPSREAIGTRTIGTKRLIILKLTTRGHTHTHTLSVSRSWNVCVFWLRKLTWMYSLAHGTLKLWNVLFFCLSLLILGVIHNSLQRNVVKLKQIV